MQPTPDDFDRQAMGNVLLMDPLEIGQVPWQPVPGCPGVHEKELWRSGDFVDALIRHEPGSSTPGRPHFAAHHHIWVISGEASIAGQPIVAGSYAHVPPGVEHTVRAGPEGCTLLQMHRPHEPREDHS